MNGCSSKKDHKGLTPLPANRRGVNYFQKEVYPLFVF